MESDSGPCRYHQLKVVEFPQDDIDQDPMQPPPYLSDNIRMFWKSCAKFLEDRSVWDVANAMMLNQAMVAYGNWMKATRLLQEEGLVQVASDHGGRKSKHPATTIQKQAIKDFRQLMNALGIPTKARQQIKWPEPDEAADDMEDLLSG